MSDKELKLCPFCGKEPYIRKGQGYEVGCKDELCYAWLPSDNEDDFWATEEQAIKAWNHRPESPLVGMDEAELKRIIHDELFHEDTFSDLEKNGSLRNDFLENMLNAITAILVKSILAKFGSPQKEPNDCMNVSYNRAGELIKNAKPDARFVEVGKIIWPEADNVKEGEQYWMWQSVHNIFDYGKAVGATKMLNACKAAVNKLIVRKEK